MKAKKSLGQNFLIDKNIIKKIINIINIENKIILEIGPGYWKFDIRNFKKRKPKKFYVIEKDNNLVSLLSNKFQKYQVLSTKMY